MVVIFDLDDTLYPERTYVESGLRAVARFGQEKFGWNARASFQFMLATLDEQGRGKVFDCWLASHGRNRKSLVDECVHVYRHHTPKLHLPADTQKLLTSLKDNPLYVVTDGHKIVQQKKAEALRLHRWFRKVLLTHRYGRKHAKPSTYCFDLIRGMEGCAWKDLVYVGDNPAKDFVNLNRVGAATVRVLTGMHKEIVVAKGYEARFTIPDLSQFTRLLPL